MKAELELEVNKCKTEEAGLRDALLKMQALNEGLGQDKIELNKIIMQVSPEGMVNWVVHQLGINMVDLGAMCPQIQAGNLLLSGGVDRSRSR